MKKALIVIDYTCDFVADDGKLTCGKPGQAIENRIAELTREFVENGEEVVMAVDVHEENDPYHPETALFPPHNIRETSGRNLYGKLDEVYRRYREQIYWMDKTRYSAFAGTDLEIRLRAKGIEEVHLVGVCTDICVLHTAVDAYNKGFRIVIHQDAVQSFDPQGHEWALRHFKGTLGATLMEKGTEVAAE
ncbi:MAG: cysteine hydrolase [Bacillaceae bacterium]|nr:cysteine hydrolase [Bacillaceae bacterium]